MAKKDNLNSQPNILKGGVDILEKIENEKTLSFIKEYKELCVKYNRIFLPSLNIEILPSDPIKKDDNNTNNNPVSSNNKQ